MNLCLSKSYEECKIKKLLKNIASLYWNGTILEDICYTIWQVAHTGKTGGPFLRTQPPEGTEQDREACGIALVGKGKVKASSHYYKACLSQYCCHVDQNWQNALKSTTCERPIY